MTLYKAIAVVSAIGATMTAKADAVRVYDVDDYVQEASSLLLHLDGIRNAGASADHNSSATTWTDLTGANELTQTGTARFSDDAWVANGSGGFNGTSSAIKEALANKAFTLEMVISHPTPTKTGNWNAYWLQFGRSGITSQQRTFYIDVGKDTSRTQPLVSTVQYLEQGWQDRSAVTANDKAKWDIRQYVAIVCDSKGATTYVDGTNEIHSTTGGTLTPTVADFAIGWTTSSNTTYALGADAEICAMRMTARSLTLDEIEANYLVDKKRFLEDRAAGKSGTANVIVAFGLDGVEDETTSGKFIAQSGDEFTAPGSIIAPAGGYVLAGYKLETWDDVNSVWGEAENHVGETSYTATGSGLVRLTWLWKLALSSKASYDVGDYVQEASSLLMHLDGIRNAGASDDHNPSATTWTDLTGTHTLTKAGTGNVAFSDDAWVADGASWFNGTSAAMTNALAGKEFTLEMVISHPTPKKTGTWYEYWLQCGDSNHRQLYVDLRSDGADTLRPLVNVVQYRESAMLDRSRFAVNDKAKWDARQYVAIVCDSTGATTYVDGPSQIHHTDGGSVNPSVDKFAIGGTTSGSSGYQLCNGVEICAIRMTARSLTTDEIKTNSRIDALRFCNAGDVTVVNGEIGDTGETGASSVPDGVYNIETGSWTFTASEVRVDSARYIPRLTVETWDGSEWTLASRQLTGSYTVVAPVASRVRLTWTWERAKGMMIIFR